MGCRRSPTHVVIGQDFTGLVTRWVSRVNAVGAPPSLPFPLSQLHTENQALSIREVCFWFLLFGVLFCFVLRSLDHRCFHWLCWGVGWPPWGQHFSSGWREQREDGPDNSAGVGGWKSWFSDFVPVLLGVVGKRTRIPLLMSHT